MTGIGGGRDLFQQGLARLDLAEFDQRGSATALQRGDLGAELANTRRPLVEVQTKLRISQTQSDGDQAIKDQHLFCRLQFAYRQFALRSIKCLTSRELIRPNLLAVKPRCDPVPCRRRLRGGPAAVRSQQLNVSAIVVGRVAAAQELDDLQAVARDPAPIYARLAAAGTSL